MEWFIIWLFVCIEKVGVLLHYGWLAMWFGVVGFGILIFATGLFTAETSSGSFKDAWEKGILVKPIRRVCICLMFFGALAGTFGSLLPNQKEMAIIVGSGITYNVVTSETGKRIGNKAVQLLEKKVDDALKDVDNGPKEKEGAKSEEQSSQQPSSKAPAQST